MKTLFLAFLKKELLDFIEKKFTVENVQALLQKALELAKAKAEETQTGIDDALIKAVEYFIDDERAVVFIVSMTRQLIEGANICCDAQGDKYSIGKEIASELVVWAEKE